mmetsp:Transcript_28205/g.86187  ORF Transcript_28205/g.86187 Transcript_28205/m.86187 type:complete len:90 (+) Transcript_28205:467-736(+)
MMPTYFFFCAVLAAQLTDLGVDVEDDALHILVALEDRFDLGEGLRGARVSERSSFPHWKRAAEAHRRLARRTVHPGSPERAHRENGEGK